MNKFVLFMLAIFCIAYSGKKYTTHDASGGDGSLLSPWTIQEGVELINGEDTLFVCASGRYTPDTSLLFNDSAWSATNAPLIRGCAADGTDDGTTPVISGESCDADVDLIYIDFLNTNIRFENLRLTGAKRYGISITNNCGDPLLKFKNITVDSSVSHGFYTDEGSLARSTIAFCEFSYNGGRGITGSGASRPLPDISYCLIHHNGSDGAYGGGSYQKAFVGNIVYKNGGIGYFTDTDGSKILGNTFFRNTSDAIQFDDATKYSILVVNNISAWNGGYFINLDGSPINGLGLVTNNTSYENTSGAISSGVLPGVSNVTTNPLFVDTTDGSEDFNLQAASPCKNTGAKNVGF